MRIVTAITAYELQLRANGRSQHTVAQARRHLGMLEGYLREHALEEVTDGDLARFLVSPVARLRADGAPKRASSMNALRSSLRAFFAYCHAAGHVRANPARLIRRAICAGLPPRALSKAEVERLLAALAGRRGRHAERDLLLVRLLLETGMRLGSALGLRVEDVDVERRELVLRTVKGGREDVAAVETELVAALAQLVGERQEGPVFAGRGGGRLGARTVQRALGEAAQRAGIKRRVRPHDLRHSFGQALYERTRDLLLVQQALGHRSILSTCRYARAATRPHVNSHG